VRAAVGERDDARAELRPTATVFDGLYQREAMDGALRRLLPPELAAPDILEMGCNGFIVREELDLLTARLSGVPTGPLGAPVLCDLGCGRGGLGRRLARSLGFQLVGIDISPAAITQAREAASSSAEAQRWRFVVADFADTGLPDASVSAVVSLDALYLAAAPRAALAEVARVLIPSGRVVFTAYTSPRHYPGTSRLLASFRPVMEDVGLVVEHYEDLTATWRRVMWSKHARRIEAGDMLLQALGSVVAPELSVSASMLGLDGRPSFLHQVERFLVTGHRPA